MRSHISYQEVHEKMHKITNQGSANQSQGAVSLHKYWNGYQKDTVNLAIDSGGLLNLFCGCFVSGFILIDS